MIRDKLIAGVRGESFPEWGKKAAYQLYLWYTGIINLLKFGDYYFFRNAAIEISTKCNRHCAYCPNSKFPTVNKLMPEKLFDKCLQRLAEINFKGSLYFHFYYEPLLDKRLPRLIAKAKRKLPNAMVRIFSNGDFLDEKMMVKLIKAGMMEVVITDHRPKAKDFESRITNLREKWAKYLSLQELERMELSNRGGLVDIKNENIKKVCIEPLMTVQIDYRGNVILCCNDFFRKHKFGNIKDEGLVSIWRKRNFAKIRKELRQGRVSLEICRKCLKIK